MLCLRVAPGRWSTNRLSRHLYRAAENSPCELLRLHRLGEEISLDQVETHFTRHEKIGAGFHALGHSAGADSIGQIENTAAHRLLQPVVGAAGDESSIDFDFDKGEIVEVQERRPVRTEIIDGDADIVQLKLAGGFRWREAIPN